MHLKGTIRMNREQNGKILILSISDLSRDPRVYRQIETLGPKYVVHTAGKIPSGIEDDFFSASAHTEKQELDRYGMAVNSRWVFFSIKFFFSFL